MNKKYLFIFLTLSFTLIISLSTDPIRPDSPSILSIIPPLIAIASAFILREVITSLFIGIWSGAWLINGKDFEALDTYSCIRKPVFTLP